MKKWVLLLVLLITLSSLPAFSASPLKPGSVCSKQGITKHYKGKKYKCIKSGNKLVWNKGVAVRPTPKPISTQISKPSISQTPSSDKIETEIGDVCPPKEIGKTIIVNQGTLICKVSPLGQINWNSIINSESPPNKKVDSNDSDFDRILFLAIQDVRSQVSLKKKMQQIVKVETGFDTRVREAALESQENVSNYFGNFFEANTIFSMVLSNSFNFTNEAFRQLGANEKWIASHQKFLKISYPEGNKLTRPIWAFASHINDDKLKPVIVYLSYPDYNFDLSALQLGAHEMFHLVQERINTTPGNLPCWMHEGGATFIGDALYKSDLNGSEIILNIMQSGGAHSAGIDLTKLESPSGWVENGHGECGDLGEYQVGRVANAFLIYKYGFTKYMQYLKSMNGRAGDGKSWKSEFQAIFETTVDNFYLEIRPYLVWFFKKFTGQSFD